MPYRLTCVLARALSIAFAALLVTLTACASSKPSGNGDGDASTEVDAPSGGEFGAVCDEDADCATVVCYVPPGESTGTCSRECMFDCPDGYACQTISQGGFDRRICIPAADTFCDTCNTDEDCGDDTDACVQLTAGKFCSLDCMADATVCPAGFSCQIVNGVGDTTRRQCLPINGICCIDGDNDRHGVGGGCLDADCDDANDEVFVGNRETCDGQDNDCAGGIDDNPIDCEGPMCELGQLGYYQRAPDMCPGAAGCQQQPAVMCGLYTCADGGEDGDVCATACDVETDTKCIDSAHCDASVCYDDFSNGQACNEDSDCESAHCQNGFCCADGDCCAVAQDCPTFGTFQPICDTPSTCQGSRGEAVCNSNFECTTQNGVPDDAACTTSVEANDCGWWRPISCAGGTTQTAPACPTTCSSHNDCDPGAWCDPVSDTCREDLDDGNACGTEDLRCKSDHCQNGFCCASGDCCATAGNCPGSYSSPPVCTSPTACDGESDVATCVASTCGTAQDVDNDSACTAGTQASDCGPYRPVFCSGSATQTPPACASSCTSDSECDASAYCNPSGQCVPDQPDGGVCLDAGECTSGHCQNGFCCASGDCCAASNDCNAYDQAAVCNTPGTCQGTKVEGLCSPTFQCGATTVDDDSGCGGIEANACGPYPPQICTSGTGQTPPSCATSCTSDTQCDISAHCEVGMCVPDTGPGGSCSMQNQCSAGLTCVDGVCCNSACGGTCMACDVPGSVGTCSPVPNMQDLDNECGAQSCVGFYHSWLGDSCRRKADVPANVASCNGAGACRTQAQECAATTTVGPVTNTCNANCQDPNLTTCTATSAGACTNVNPGTQTCGVGACTRTVNQCSAGAPLTCNPGSPTTETCNNIDDNCDGTVDNGAFSDAYESNPDCGTATLLGAVGSGGTNTYTSMTVYGSGDWDYYRIPMNETDNSCGCGVSFDEDYQARVTITPPVGSGSYEFCMNTNTCGWPAGYCTEVAAGQTVTYSQYLDGACPGADNYTVYVRVRGLDAPGFECSPYTLSYQFISGLCR
jgi:hypothetical protein